MEEIRLKLPEIKRPRNPFSDERVRALAIVMAFVVLISAIVYLSLVLRGKKSSAVLPATTQQEVTAEAEPTKMPAPTEEPSPTPEETPIATPSVIPTEALGEVLPEVPSATSSPPMTY